MNGITRVLSALSVTVVVTAGAAGCGGGSHKQALIPDVPTSLGTSLAPVQIYEVAYDKPASQTRAAQPTQSEGATPTRRVLTAPLAKVSVAAAHVVGSGTRWQVVVVLSKPSVEVKTAYQEGRQFVARVDGMDAPVLATNDGPDGLPAYAFMMGDHRQAAEAAARTWTTQVTTTDRSA